MAAAVTLLVGCREKGAKWTIWSLYSIAVYGFKNGVQKVISLF